MRALPIGDGARAHALAWKIAQSPRLEQLHAAPGNPGIARVAECEGVHYRRDIGRRALARR